MQKEGIDVKVSASVSAEGIGSVSAEAGVKTDTSKLDKFQKSVEKTEIVTIGSKPPKDGRSHSVRNPFELYLELLSWEREASGRGLENNLNAFLRTLRPILIDTDSFFVHLAHILSSS